MNKSNKIYTSIDLSKISYACYMISLKNFIKLSKEMSNYLTMFVEVPHVKIQINKRCDVSFHKVRRCDAKFDFNGAREKELSFSVHGLVVPM